MPLLVAATPIGNLQDAAPRLLDALRAADLVLAEDTRRARKLCSAFGLPTPPLLSSHAHNERGRVERVRALLERGGSVLLLTDAGMPGISDPGEAIVTDAHRQGLPVSVIPGPSAVVAALAASGLPAVPSCFLGFPPRKAGARQRFLRSALQAGGSFVLFEGPGRSSRLVSELAALAPTREACLCRELSKLHEELLRLPLPELAERLSHREIKGEVTLVVGPGEAPPAPEPAAVHGQAGAAEALARAWGLPRREIYRALSRLKDELGREEPG